MSAASGRSERAAVREYALPDLLLLGIMDGASDFSVLDPLALMAELSGMSASVSRSSERLETREYALADLVDGIIEGLDDGDMEGEGEGTRLGAMEGASDFSVLAP